jgi:predicted Ser/Thr protein kinase
VNERMVSHYRVLGPIGGGGMGVVYDAEDTRLGRRVALKFVPVDLARDEKALARLVREARAVSALNHPHICSLFDIGEHDGQPFLVMERLEGKTLRNAIAGAPLPIARVLELGAQIADALEAAHAKGIVHRDIKPSNVFLTRRGDAKLLDFGLAKLAEPPRRRVDPDAPTSSGEPDATPRPGKAAGTAGYMSPEQARGEEVDARTDLFSLGAVLYEMATGHPPFPGPTPAVIFESLLGRAPAPPRASNPEITPAVEAILAKALEKDRELRYQTAADLRVDLRRARRVAESASFPPAATTGAPPPLAAARRVPWRGLAAAAALLVAVGVGAWVSRALDRHPPPRFTQLTFRRGIVLSARFSPDGETVVYSALWDGRPPEVFTRRLDSPASVSLGLPPSLLLSVSSKGELAVLVAPPGERGVVWLGTLARVPLSGGPLRPVLDDVLDADWSPDGSELAAIRWLDGEFQVEYPLGHVLLRPCLGTRLRVSPRGDQVALLEPGGILVVDRAGREKTLPIPPAHQRLAWWPDGRSLLADAADSDLHRTLRRVSLGGRVSEVCALAGTLVVHDVSRDGRVLLHHGLERWSVRARAPGEKEEHGAPVFANSQVQGLSGDGSQILLWDGGEGPPGSALLLPTRGGPPLRLAEGHPVGLSPDAAWFLLQRPGGAGSRLFLMPTGPGPAREVPLGGLQLSGTWFVDGHGVGFHAAEPGRPPRSFFVDMDSGKRRAVTPEGVLAIPRRLPDGDILARSRDGSILRISLSGGESRPLPWKLPSDPYLETLGPTADGRFLVVREGSVPAHLDRIEIESGRRTRWRTFGPEDATGVGHIWTILLARDGDGYAYTHGLFLQDLFLASFTR